MRNTTSTIDRMNMMMWITFVIAVLALFLAAVTFNLLAATQNTTPTDLIQEELMPNPEDKALTNANDRLEKLRKDVTTGAKNIDIQAEMTKIREDLKDAFTSPGGNTTSNGTALDNELKAIQEKLRTGALKVENAIDQMIARIKMALPK